MPTRRVIPALVFDEGNLGGIVIHTRGLKPLARAFRFGQALAFHLGLSVVTPRQTVKNRG